MAQAPLVIADRLLVVAGQVVGMAELEEGARVAGVEFHGPFQVADRLGPLPFGEKTAGELEMILGAVSRHFFELVENGPRLGELALEPVNAGALELDLGGGI